MVKREADLPLANPPDHPLRPRCYKNPRTLTPDQIQGMCFEPCLYRGSSGPRAAPERRTGVAGT